MKIVFMGTPDFAVGCLERLILDGHEVAAVFTREDKPVGRKQILTPPPVKQAALRHDIPVYQPKKVKDNPEAVSLLASLAPDLIVVAAYGRLLPREILEIPRLGCVNVHASLLPRHRGASPIQWAIVSGDRVTGVTTMLMDEGMDTGDILEMSELVIRPEETAETLHDRLSAAGAELLSSTVHKLADRTVTPRRQPEEGVTYAPIITKEMGALDFAQNAGRLDCLIRGFIPWPQAYFYYGGRRFKVLKAAVTESEGQTPGVCFEQDGEVCVACGENTALRLLEVCPDGSRRMDGAAFKNGRFIPNGASVDSSLD